MMPAALPLFHLHDDSPRARAFDFIHVESIAARAAMQDWVIRAQRHGNLSQILFVAEGGGEMTHEAAVIPFAAPAAILAPSRVAHGFRFQPGVTKGWVISFTDDVAAAAGDQSDAAWARLRALAANPIVPLGSSNEGERLSKLCAELHEESFLAREGFRLAMRGLLLLIAIEVVRLAASLARTGAVTLAPGDKIVAALRELIDESYRRERRLAFYAGQLAMTPGRLNDHVKRVTGVTAGHLIRQRLLGEARSQLVFGNRAIQDIAVDLGFSDPSHFARFFRKQTGMTPQVFRERRRT